MYKDIECPYCGHEQDICHDDGFGYQEDVKHEMECAQCEKSFVFTTCVSFSYEAEKADCLNGGDHDWKPNTVFPREYTQMVCTMCDEHRNLTKEEKFEFIKADKNIDKDENNNGDTKC